MKTHKIASLLVLAALLAALFGAALPAAAQQVTDPTLTVPPQYVNANQQFTVDVTLDTDGITVTGWQFDYAWNPAVVRLDSIVEGPFIRSWVTSVGGAGTFFQPPIINQGAGTLRGAAVTALGAPAGQGAQGTGVIATLTFTALANGLSTNNLSGVILVQPGSVGYPGTIVLNSGFFQVGPAPRVVVTALGFTPVGAGQQFNVTFTVQNQGGMASGTETADVTAVGAAPTQLSVTINPLQPSEIATYSVPFTYQLDPQAVSALITVALPSGSRSATYSPTSASGQTDVDATFGAYLEITPPALIEFNPLNIGGNDRFGDMNVKCNTNYVVDAYDNNATTNWRMVRWDGTTYYQTPQLTYPLIVKNNPQNYQVSLNTPPRIIDGLVTGQSGNAGQNFPLVFNTTRDIADPLLPTGSTYHMVLTWNSYIVP
jgi:hypothetical protein